MSVLLEKLKGTDTVQHCRSLASSRLTIHTTLTEVLKSGRDLRRKQMQILFQLVMNYFA